MTISHAANRSAAPALGWACALLLGVLMAGVLLCAALFVSSRRNVEAADNLPSEFNAARVSSPRTVESARPAARSQPRAYESAAGSAD